MSAYFYLYIGSEDELLGGRHADQVSTLARAASNCASVAACAASATDTTDARWRGCCETCAAFEAKMVTAKHVVGVVVIVGVHGVCGSSRSSSVVVVVV